MLSLSFLWAFIFNWMPHPRRLWFLGLKFVIMYNKFYENHEASVIKFHRAELSRLDWNFRMTEASHELSLRKRIATEKGIDPLSPDSPDFEDVLKD